MASHIRRLLTVGPLYFTLLLASSTEQTAAEEYTDAVHAYLRQCVGSQNVCIGIVVGMVDEHGARVVGYGKLDNGTDADVDGDTVFEIGSDTKTFTALLLQDMIERGEMRLDDAVAKYLPALVTMPSRNGKDITLRHLATHTSGLPCVPDNFDPKRADNPYADYTVEMMYSSLSRHQLTRDPGAKSEYSNFGMGLLGHVIALKAGTSYEALVVERICRPLQMDSTCISLTPKLKSRFATPHNRFEETVPYWDAPTLPGAGALRSTVNDLLKYVSANLNLTPSTLMPLMEQTHDLGLAWHTATERDGARVTYHGGGTGGCRSFLAFDKARRRGVVVLTNSNGVIDVGDFGNFLLNCEWQSDRRPTSTKGSPEAYDAYVGHYQRVQSAAWPISVVRQSVLAVPHAAIWALVVCSLAVLGVCVRRMNAFRKRVIVVGCVVLMTGLAAAAVRLPKSTAAAPEAGIGIRRSRERLFAAAVGTRSWPINVLLPPNAGELLPESETRFFERLSGRRITILPGTRGQLTRLSVSSGGETFVYQKISDEVPAEPAPRKPRVAIKLDAEFLDSFVGQYEFAPSAAFPAGVKVRIWRETDQLLWQEQGENTIPGAIEIFPESETSFFNKIDASRVTFEKNPDGQVTAVVLRLAELPDLTGKKVASD